MFLESIIGPTIFTLKIGGFSLPINWYPTAYFATFLWCWVWIRFFAGCPDLWRDGKSPVTRAQVDRGRLWIFAGVIVGARLGYIVFYHPSYFMAQPLEVLKVWNGGMSFHGGLIGVILFGIIYAVRNKIPIISGFDTLAVTVPFGFLLGRIANFFNGELWGRPSDVPWALVFPGRRAGLCPDDWLGLCTRHPSQLYEAFLEGLLLSVVLFWLVLCRRGFMTPGLVSGVFLLGYGLARFLVEFYRQPDPQFMSATNPAGHVLRLTQSPEAWGVTMGQALSVPMIVLGIIWIDLAIRRKKA